MKIIDIDLGGYKILQLKNSSRTQMMSYIITTPSGKIFVIDGGMEADCGYLARVLRSMGGKVDVLLISHAHGDHFGAPFKLFKGGYGVEFGCLLINLPPRKWLTKAEPGSVVYETPDKFYEDLACYKGLTIKPRQGDVYTLDGMEIRVLKDCSDYMRYDETEKSPINDTSIVVQVCFPNGKTALFLGDLGEHSGDVLAEMYGEDLRSDIVQMAHHGQQGTGKNVYELVNPSVCLWPTPDWLWTNDSGKGYNSGPWETFETREWMESLGVKLHGREFDGDVLVK